MARGYLIIRIEPAKNATLREADKLPVIETVVRRHALASFSVHEVERALEGSGFQIGPAVGCIGPGWDLTAHVYTSPNKDGYGRAGSQLASWPCRRRAS